MPPVANGTSPDCLCLSAGAGLRMSIWLPPPGEPEEEGAEDKQTPPLPSNARSGGWKAKLCTRTNPNQFHRPVQLHPSFHLRYHHLKGMSTGYYVQQVSEKKRGKEERKRKNKKRRNTQLKRTTAQHSHVPLSLSDAVCSSSSFVTKITLSFSSAGTLAAAAAACEQEETFFFHEKTERKVKARL